MQQKGKFDVLYLLKKMEFRYIKTAKKREKTKKSIITH